MSAGADAASAIGIAGAVFVHGNAVNIPSSHIVRNGSMPQAPGLTNTNGYNLSLFYNPPVPPRRSS